MKTFLIAISLFSAAALAQPASSEKSTLLKHWKTSGEFTLAVASAMPTGDYGFRPVPVEMSFGELMAHIASADINACAIASGLERPAPSAKIAAWAKSPIKVDVDKDTATAYLHQAFDFCDRAISGITADRLDNIQGPAKRNMTGFEWLWSYFTHTAHHRGQAEVYMRLKGIQPPGYRF
jgi:uncharacterized damage-inducible protein DinB